MPAIVETSVLVGAGAALLQRHDRDRYLLSLFVPVARRGVVQTLYAFNSEIARIREHVTDPVLGQMRLQWWREGIDAAYGNGAVARHEVLTPLAEAIRQFGFSRGHFERLIAAREEDLSPEPPATLEALDAYAERSSAPLQLLVLEALGAVSPTANEAAREAAIAYALAGLLRAAPFLVRSARHAVPPFLIEETERVVARAQVHLDAARVLRGEVPSSAFPSLLPAVLAAADLARLRRARFDSSAPALARPDVWRAWRLAAASWLRRY
jgi:NADH dehydrogenase [ubiquinone] 1 alpha subcomplex assembly factor 6